MVLHVPVWSRMALLGPIGRGANAKRVGALEYCSQKEMDGIDHGRRIWDKSTALVAFSVNRVIYPAFTNRMNSSTFQ